MRNLLIAVLLSMTASAQTVTATLEPVQEAGLHRIALPREIRAYGKTGLTDLRLYDARQREIPFAILRDGENSENATYTTLPILSTNRVKGKTSTYVIDLGGRKPVDALSLFIANTDARKRYDLSGSNDGDTWFGIANRATLDGLNDPGKTEVVRDIRFPLSAFRYLKITFNDSLSLPVRIERISLKTDLPATPAGFETFTGKSQDTFQDRAEKMTVVTTDFDHPEIIDRISFDIAGPDFYRRQARVMVRTTETYGRHHRKRTIDVPYCFFELQSGAANSFRIPQFSGNTIRIEIDNRDNPPLDIRRVSFGQEILYAVADLKSGETYRLNIGEKGKMAPGYDIAMRKIELGTLPSARIKNVSVSRDTSTKRAAGRRFWQQTGFIWACILLGGAVLAYFALSLVKDMRRGGS